VIDAEIQLDIGGMTCASCAARIEKKLNRMEGVRASVNYATEKANVFYVGDVTPDDLVAEIVGIGYSACVPPTTPTHDESTAVDLNSSTRALRERLIVCAVLALPVVALAMIPALQFDGWQWVSLELTIPVVVWGAWQFHRAAWLNARHGAATMDTLISVGTIAAFGWSLYSMVLGSAGALSMRHGFSISPQRGVGANQIYLEVVAGVTVFILAGRYFEARAKRRSGAALKALLELGAKDVAVLRRGREMRVPVEQLAVGDHFVVRPGEKVATDGVIVEGTSTIDASPITGEPVPIDVHPGVMVTGATLNVSGRLVVKATRVGADTVLAQIGQLVEEAQAGKAQVQRLADRVAAVFVPVVIALSVATLGFWLTAASTAQATTAFTAAVAVLIIACPCALGLATPTALMVGTGRGAQLGIVIKGPEILESTRAIEIMVFDKTGTLTTGQMSLIDVVTTADATIEQALLMAGSLEDASEHPIARAIASGARDRGLELLPIESFVSAEGLGVRGVVAGHSVVAGRERFLAESSLTLDDTLRSARDVAEAAGQTPIYVAWDGAARAVVVVADAIKPSAAPAIARLRKLGIHPALLTGDNERTANSIAAKLGIDDVFAEALPADKVDIIRQLQAHGRIVAMVGDGINDAAALAQADLGLAMGTGTDAAIAASDITLVRGDVNSAVDAIRLSRRTLTTIKTNLFWAFAYNVAALPLAAAGLLNPMLAGLSMACSSVFVVTNSLRLRRFQAIT
jgi:P-type Cu+ transporter